MIKKIILFFLISNNALSDVYKWEDENGFVHYTRKSEIPYKYLDEAKVVAKTKDNKYKKSDSGNLESSRIYEWEDDQGNIFFGRKYEIPSEYIDSAKLAGSPSEIVGSEPEPEEESHYADLDVIYSPKEHIFIDIRRSNWSKSGKFDRSDLHRTAAVVQGESGHGSGVFISNNKLLTNYHVVKDQNRITVKNNDFSSVAKVIRVNSHRDIALLEIEEDEYNDFLIAQTAIVEPKVGDDLFVIGAPLDVSLSNTLTKGVLSAIREELIEYPPLLRFYQTDASLNKGNSGGPLFNSNSELVAISVSGLLTKSGSGLNINYLIPIEDALESLNILVNPVSVGSYSFWEKTWDVVNRILNHEIKLYIN